MRFKRRNIKRNITEAFELPKEVLLDLPRLTVISDVQLTIENHRGIVEYTASKVRVNLGSSELVVEGNNLVIAAIGEDEIIVEGTLRQIGFE